MKASLFLCALITSLALASFTGGCARTTFDDGGLNSGLGAPGDGGGGGGGGGGTPPPASSLCALDGTWERCVDNGATSTRETLTFAGTGLTQVLDFFIVNDTCTGAPVTTTPIASTVAVGAPGASSAISGATDLDITAAIDLGCGVGNTQYSAIDFSPDCTQLFVSDAPGCDPLSRGLTLDANTYLIQ